MKNACRNCALYGRKANAVRGHTCVDVDPCERCGGARMLRVIEVFAQGGVTRERTCKGCSQKLREEAA
jgi:hypothetical protein